QRTNLKSSELALLSQSDWSLLQNLRRRPRGLFSLTPCPRRGRTITTSPTSDDDTDHSTLGPTVMSKSLHLHVMPGDIRIVHSLAASSTVAIGINASGDIVGTYRGASDFGFVYRGGTYKTLDMNGIETEACGINASGYVVGSYIEKTAEGFK